MTNPEPQSPACRLCAHFGLPPRPAAPGLGVCLPCQNRLVEENTGLVWAVWQRQLDARVLALGEQEAVAAGNVGLVRAARRWDPGYVSARTGRPVRFSTLAWLYVWRSMANAAACFVRQTRRVRPMSQLGAGKVDHAAEVPDRAAPRPEGPEEVAHLLARAGLTPKQRWAVRLKYLRGFSLATIGRSLGLTRERARQLVLSALQKMRECADPQ